MITSICFTFILLYILYSISTEDINTMLISENKLISFAISGQLYLLCIGLSNGKIYTIKLILNKSFSMLLIYILMFSISYIVIRFAE